MPIHILPPQLTNQIAAGEVVERPSSVVKELVENCLDAGADNIQIDIEQGGASLIRVRDNGCGIAKDELSLALARHATSKISCLDDLENILSLGFRGEALASISSVSRLTLTSRPEHQAEAWQVSAQGRDMETTLKPAAHPVGTTVEVATLFFNTPARRKFLRTEKTEFIHIDEVIRRIALVKTHAQITLTHNGKVIRQYPKALTRQQQLKRLTQICGQQFVKNAIEIDWKHSDLHLYGWVSAPHFTTQNEINYSYVNGRMMRDKTINHAIRQAYTEKTNENISPAFVLFIDLNPNQVDVNVHPAKHEVRFHQSRLVHDFIYQGVLNALNNSEQRFDDEELPPVDTNRKAAGSNMFITAPDNNALLNSTLNSNKPAYSYTKAHPPAQQIDAEQKIYHQLTHSEHKTPAQKVVFESQPNYTTLPKHKFDHVETKTISTKYPVDETTKLSNYLQILTFLENHQLIILEKQQQLYCIPVNRLLKELTQSLLVDNSAQQTLLIPISLKLTETQYQSWQKQISFFKESGFDITEYVHDKTCRITISRVPQILRQQNLQSCIISLLNQSIETQTDFIQNLLNHIHIEPLHSLAEATSKVGQLEQISSQKLDALLIPIQLPVFKESE